MTWLRTLLLLALILTTSACGRRTADVDCLAMSPTGSGLHAGVEEVHGSKRHIRIAIDPGHGGKDPGTQSLDTPKYQEKFLALATSLMLEKHLRRLGYAPFLTRDQDAFIPLQKRVDISHEESADLFVSVHYNAAPNRQAHGVEVYYYKSDLGHARAEDSKKLAQNVLNCVIEQTEARSRGIKHGNFLVIRNTKIPAILVEGGFVSNQAEMQQLSNPEYLNKVAWGIARGIDDYLLDIR